MRWIYSQDMRWIYSQDMRWIYSQEYEMNIFTRYEINIFTRILRGSPEYDTNNLNWSFIVSKKRKKKEKRRNYKWICLYNYIADFYEITNHTLY